MSGRRGRGDGSVFFDASRGCWVGVADLGRDPKTRKRIRRKVSGKSKTEGREKPDEHRAAPRTALPRGTRLVSRSMKPDQVTALLGLKLDAWWRAFITSAIMLGLRPGELLGLCWEDVDLDGGVIRVRHSLKKVDGVPMPADLKTP